MPYNAAIPAASVQLLLLWWARENESYSRQIHAHGELSRVRFYSLIYLSDSDPIRTPLEQFEIHHAMPDYATLRHTITARSFWSLYLRKSQFECGQMFMIHIQASVFKFLWFEERFRKASFSWRMSVEASGPNRRNKAALSNFCDVE